MRIWLRWYRVLFALLVLAAIFVQLSRSSGRGFSTVNFFSFFTIESNLFAALVLLWQGTGIPPHFSQTTTDFIRGAAVLYMTITGVVYGLLLAGYQQELQTTGIHTYFSIRTAPAVTAWWRSTASVSGSAR